jgi:hypothetical protein
MRSLIVVAGGSFVQLTFVKVNGSQYTVSVHVSQSIMCNAHACGPDKSMSYYDWSNLDAKMHSFLHQVKLQRTSKNLGRKLHTGYEASSVRRMRCYRSSRPIDFHPRCCRHHPTEEFTATMHQAFPPP